MSDKTDMSAKAKMFDLSGSKSRVGIFGTSFGPMIVNLDGGEETKKDIENWLDKNNLSRRVSADLSVDDEKTVIKNISIVDEGDSHT